MSAVYSASWTESPTNSTRFPAKISHARSRVAATSASAAIVAVQPSFETSAGSQTQFSHGRPCASHHPSLGMEYNHGGRILGPRTHDPRVRQRSTSSLAGSAAGSCTDSDGARPSAVVAVAKASCAPRRDLNESAAQPAASDASAMTRSQRTMRCRCVVTRDDVVNAPIPHMCTGRTQLDSPSELPGFHLG